MSQIGCKAMAHVLLVGLLKISLHQHIIILSLSVNSMGSYGSALCKSGRRSVTGLKILILKKYRAVAINPSKSSNNVAVIETVV